MGGLRHISSVLPLSIYIFFNNTIINNKYYKNIKCANFGKINFAIFLENGHL